MCDILNLSKVESGKLQIKRSDVYLKELIEHVIVDAFNYSKSKNKNTQIKIQHHIEEDVSEDFKRLLDLVRAVQSQVRNM